MKRQTTRLLATLGLFSLVGCSAGPFCSAALAAAGKGAGARELSSEQRSDLRAQAVLWLRAELDAWQRVVAADEQARTEAIVVLRHALETDADLATIRDRASLENLQDSEREACEAMWLDYRTVLQRLEKRR